MNFLQVTTERGVHNGKEKRNPILDILKALGVDPNTTPDELTLAEIGIESMFAIELQQELERKLKTNISVNHMKSINVGLFKQFANDNVESIQQFIKQLKNAQEHLANYKFLMPSDSFTKLNTVKVGRPIYFMPPLEITFSSYELFAQKFDRPVIGLNWTRDMNKFKTFKEVNQYFTDLLKKFEPKGDYDLVGYLDGAIVVAKQLIRGRFRKGVIIDVITEEEEKALTGTISNDMILGFFFNLLSCQLPESFVERIRRNIFKGNDTTDKIRRMVNEFKELVGRGVVAQDMEEILTIGLKRVQILWEYRLKKNSEFGNKLKERIGKKWTKKSGKLHVIKAFKFDKVDDVDEHANIVRDTYLLPDDKVNFYK